MAENTAQPVIQVPGGVNGASGAQPPAGSSVPSQPSGGPEAPGAVPNGSQRPRNARTRGVPGGPVTLAAVNTAACTGSAAYGVGGPGMAIATGVGAALAAAALTSKPGRRRNSATPRRSAARSNAGPKNRSGRFLGSGGSSPRTKNNSGSGPGRTGSGKGGGGSAPARSGSPTSGSVKSGGPAGSGSGRKRPGSGLGGPGGSGVRAGSGSRKIGSGGPRVRSGSGKTRSGLTSGVGSGSGPIGSGSGKHKKNKRKNNRSNGKGSNRPRLLRSSPNRTSALRKMIGPRPGTGPNAKQGGLIRRGDGTKRQPIRALRNGGKRVADVARAIRHGARVAGRGIKKAHNSTTGKKMRQWTTGAAKRAWGVGWPTLAAATQFTTNLLRGRGFRAAWAAARGAWTRARAKWTKDKTETPGAATPGVPGSTVTRPTTAAVGAPVGNPAATGGGISMAQAQFNTAAAEMLGAALTYSPDGMMQVGRDFVHMGTAFRNIAQAMQTMAARADDQDPLNPAIIDMLKEMHSMLQGVASKADELAPAFKSLHAVDIKRIAEPRNGEGRWDLSANADFIGTGL